MEAPLIDNPDRFNVVSVYLSEPSAHDQLKSPISNKRASTGSLPKSKHDRNSYHEFQVINLPNTPDIPDKVEVPAYSIKPGSSTINTIHTSGISLSVNDSRYMSSRSNSIQGV